MKKYQVIVGNIGTVTTVPSLAEAEGCYEKWVKISKAAYGRASGESVTLMVDGEPIKEHEPEDQA